jgi:hypothetical protein
MSQQGQIVEQGSHQTLLAQGTPELPLKGTTHLCGRLNRRQGMADYGLGFTVAIVGQHPCRQNDLDSRTQSLGDDLHSSNVILVKTGLPAGCSNRNSSG